MRRRLLRPAVASRAFNSAFSASSCAMRLRAKYSSMTASWNSEMSSSGVSCMPNSLYAEASWVTVPAEPFQNSLPSRA
jgi:hypothetical protein